MMYGKPFPSSPNRFSAGISTLSKAISPVSDALQPNLSNFVDDIPMEAALLIKLFSLTKAKHLFVL